jgi:hypothetical protein
MMPGRFMSSPELQIPNLHKLPARPQAEGTARLFGFKPCDIPEMS